jgi:hypothetical protein
MHVGPTWGDCRGLGFPHIALTQLVTNISSTPPIGIAEACAVFGCFSRGWLIAGWQAGSSSRWSIAVALRGSDRLLKSPAKEFFAWNGKYRRYPKSECLA